jgi:CRISPR-associated protein Cst2
MTTSKSISIAARVVLDLHALNNEGSESNRLLTRQVGIVTPQYEATELVGYNRSTVNAISGDMNKHIFANAFRLIALERNAILCEACKALDPARMMGNPEFQNYIKGKPAPAQVIERLIKECSMDDVCGIMITGEGTSVKRKSAVEFGWTVGLPDITEVQEFIHARHAVTRLTRTKASKESDPETKQKAKDEAAQNTGQMIFNRPASSGVYAFVANLDVCAIGFNDATQQYDISPEERAERLRIALLALSQSILHPKGALTSTQLPHVVDIQGYVSFSQTAAAAPLISPLHDEYVTKAKNVANMNNRLYGRDSNYVLEFSGGDGLLEQFAQIIDNTAPGVYRGE